MESAMVVRVNDFETVRKEIIDPETGSVDPEVSAALDRIEAEVERLRASLKLFKETAGILAEEKEDPNDGHDPYIRDLKAEVEHLRADKEALQRLVRRILIVDTGVVPRGASQPLVVEQLLPDELITAKGGTRELVWEQGNAR
jgi:hypothetical protein